MYPRSQNPLAAWRPASGAIPGDVFGWTFTSAGTVSHPAVKTGSVQTQARRTEWTQTKAGQVGGIVTTTPICWRGNISRLGGFSLSARFTLTANPARSRAFIGLSASNTQVCLGDPSTTSNTIGVGFDATDPKGGFWYVICRDATTLNKIKLDGMQSGGSTPAPRNVTDVYDLILLANPNEASIYVRLLNYTTGETIYNGAVAASANIPAQTANLYVHCGVGLAAAATTKFDLYGLDVCSSGDGAYAPQQPESLLHLVSGGPIPTGSAVQIGASGQILAATAQPRHQAFLGVAVEAASVAGQIVGILGLGLLDPAIKTVGAGVACAVGVDGTGQPVRSTDPTCVSASNWLGNCDTAGTITIAPRQSNVNNVLDFGADPTHTISSQLAFETALGSSLPGGVVFVPPGRYIVTAQLDMPTGVTIRGSGWTDVGGSFIDYQGATGDCIRACTQPSTNTAWYVVIEDLAISLSNLANRNWTVTATGPKGGAAIGILGGGIIRVRRVNATGAWRYGVACDGGEECDFTECCFFNSLPGGDIPTDWSVGLWFGAGSRGMSVGDATNVNHVSRCYANAPAFGFWLEGGSSNTIRECLVNIQSTSNIAAFALIGSGWKFNDIEDCYSEGSSAAGAHFLFAGVAINLKIVNHLASGNTPFARLGPTPLGSGVAYGLRIEDCLLACDWIVGSQYITGVHVSLNNVMELPKMRGDLMYDVDPGMTAGLVANWGTSGGYTLGTTGNPRADHHWALKTFNRPLHLDASGSYDFRSYTIRSLFGETDLVDECWSGRSGQPMGMRETKSSKVTTASGPDVNASELTVPVGGQHGLVRIYVKGLSAFDETKGAHYVMRQRVYRPSGGSVQLLGTPTTELSDADTGFVAPVIGNSTTAVFAILKARADGEAYWYVRLEYEAVRE